MKSIKRKDSLKYFSLSISEYINNGGLKLVITANAVMIKHCIKHSYIL